MSDFQLRQKAFIQKVLVSCAILLLLSAGLFYFRYTTGFDYNTYVSQISQEPGVQKQIDTLTKVNNDLMLKIEENGKQLVSFSEDKIKYINLASELSIKHTVRINKLLVSDVWADGVMSGMTTTIEVEGSLGSIQSFIDEYCGVNYTNRISVVSCRPSGRYAWLKRTIDGDKVLSWFDLSEDNNLYNSLHKEKEQAIKNKFDEFGIPANLDSLISNNSGYAYNEATGRFYDIKTGLEVDQEVLDETPLSIEKMFADKDLKVYLVIDFLGRV